ncbi:hypothetical protein FALBO_13039 [Fusarium albosuccineum]|uniref:DNA-directed RNA polymerase n=1 Tax=Fusarium albosuccineum TaxID=1237068 RepID=A0A8H4L2Z9_9HYPO|nr:hypothetical protein FALBO_13039 [Fusarium albosuccineum]
MSTDKVIATKVMPELSRVFPDELEYMLVLRHSLKKYRSNMGRVVTSTESPEGDGDGLSNGRIYTMAACPPIIGHAVIINESLCVCENLYADVHDTDMAPMVLKTAVPTLKWLVGAEPNFTFPERVKPNTLMALASQVYINGGPLCLYDNHAVVESTNHTPTNTFWQNLYPPLESVESHLGPVGLIHDNITMSLGTIAGSESEPNVEERIPKMQHAGFLDACYTPSSKSSGKVRTVVFSVTKRVKTIRTREIAFEILSIMRSVTSMGPKTWIVRCEGICTETTDKAVKMMVSKWKTYSEPDMPVLHLFSRGMTKKVMVVSMAQGVLIRPLRWIPRCDKKTGRWSYSFEGPYVDTVAVHISDTMEMAGLKFPKQTEEPEQYFSALALMVPFGAWTAEPRLNLGVQMMRQGLSVNAVKGDATMTSVGINNPMVVTPLTKVLMDSTTEKIKMVLPGKNLVMAFINRTLNSEDALSVSKELAESGMFAWSGYIDYPLPKNAAYVRVGMTVKDQYWWAPSIEGVIMDIRMSKMGDQIAVVYVASKKLMVGDKLGTYHGLKFTVGEIIPYSEMPSIQPGQGAGRAVEGDSGVDVDVRVHTVVQDHGDDQDQDGQGLDVLRGEEADRAAPQGRPDREGQDARVQRHHRHHQGCQGQLRHNQGDATQTHVLAQAPLPVGHLLVPDGAKGQVQAGNTPSLGGRVDVTADAEVPVDGQGLGDHQRPGGVLELLGLRPHDSRVRLPVPQAAGHHEAGEIRPAGFDHHDGGGHHERLFGPCLVPEVHHAYMMTALSMMLTAHDRALGQVGLHVRRLAERGDYLRVRPPARPLGLHRDAALSDTGARHGVVDEPAPEHGDPLGHEPVDDLDVERYAEREHRRYPVHRHGPRGHDPVYEVLRLALRQQHGAPGLGYGHHLGLERLGEVVGEHLHALGLPRQERLVQLWIDGYVRYAVHHHLPPLLEPPGPERHDHVLGLRRLGLGHRVDPVPHEERHGRHVQ